MTACVLLNRDALPIIICPVEDGKFMVMNYHSSYGDTEPYAGNGGLID